MNSLRVLLFALEANPGFMNTRLIGYLHAEALARLRKLTLVVRGPDEGAVRRAGGHSMQSKRSIFLEKQRQIAGYWA